MRLDHLLSKENCLLFNFESSISHLKISLSTLMKILSIATFDNMLYNAVRQIVP